MSSTQATPMLPPQQYPVHHPIQQQLNNSTQQCIKVMTNTVISTLQILGFDFSGAEKHHKIVFNAATFAKPNAKAFELVVHFLLCQLDPERAQRAFNQCWPPLLKEQQRDFKDIVFNWLNEIHFSSKLASSSGGGNIQQQQQQLQSSALKTQTIINTSAGPMPPPSFNIHQFSSHHQHLITQIKVPSMPKSLFSSPGGIKIVELLLNLCQYVQLIRCIRIIEKDKLNIRIMPKVAPLPHTSFSLNPPVPPHVLGEQQTNRPSAVKLVNQKQLLQYDLIISSLKQQIQLELNQFIELVNHQIKVRSKWQLYASEKTVQIKKNLERRQQLQQSIKRKLAAFSSFKSGESIQMTNGSCSGNTEEPINLEKLYSNLVENKLDEINEKCLEFEKLGKELFQSSESSSIDYILNEKAASNYKIDGDDLKKYLGSDTNEKILKCIFENIDKNIAIRNTKVGSLYNEESKKLDLINLTRLFNLVLLLKGDLITKIDINQLNNLAISQTSAPNQEFQPWLKTSIAEVNKQAAELKQKLDAFLPKLSERCNFLSEKLTKNISLEKSEAATTAYQQNKLSLDDAKDEEEAELMNLANEVMGIFDEYFEYRRRPFIDIDRVNHLFSEKENNNCSDEASASSLLVLNQIHTINNKSSSNRSSNKFIEGVECDANFMDDMDNLAKFKTLSLSNSTMSSESLTSSTKLFNRQFVATGNNHHYHHNNQPNNQVSPILDRSSSSAEHQQHQHDQPSSHSNSGIQSEEAHSSLQILDFDDENMDLI